MNRTKIEWCDYTINPVKGLCPMACPYCYARAMYKRFKWNPEIRMEPDWADDLPKKPARVFVGSTMELFGDWVEKWMWDSIWQYVNGYPQHTFIFLTKRPQNLIKWSPFPKNVWVGVSATDTPSYQDACLGLREVEAKIRFISFEPLLGAIYTEILNPIPLYYNPRGIPFDWVIIGQQTPVKMSTMPKIGWVEDIVNACDKANIPVFLKDNLNSCAIPDYPALLNKGNGFMRQEFPLLNYARREKK